MKKNKRYYSRLAILTILVSLVIYTFYNHFFNEKSEKPVVGETAPNFQLENLDGEKISLNDLRGKVVLVNFWGTWCKPCLDEMPAIQKVYDEYKKDGFEVLAVNLGESDVAISRFKETVGVNFPILKDTDNAVTDLYDVYLLPASFLINQEGKIIESIEGELHIEVLNEWMGNALKLRGTTI